MRGQPEKAQQNVKALLWLEYRELRRLWLEVPRLGEEVLHSG